MIQRLSSAGNDRVLWIVAAVLLAATAILVLGWLATLLTPRRDAAARHTTWLATLLGVLLVPWLVIALDQSGLTWHVRVFPPSAGDTVPSAPPEVVVSSLSFPAASVPDEAFSVPDEVLSIPETSSDQSPATAAPAPATTALAIGWRELAAVGLLVWAFGTLLLVVRLLGGIVTLTRFRARCQPIENVETSQLLTEITGLIGLPARPRLFVGDGLESPVAMGMLRPAIVLPASFESPEAARDVLIHEAAHLLRRDPLVGLLQRLAGALFWPHPLIVVLNRGLARAREEVCDNYVLRYGDRFRYSRTLLELEGSFEAGPRSLAAVALFSSRWDLSERITGLLDERRIVMLQARPLRKIGTAVLLLAIGLTLGSLRPAAAVAPSDPSPVATQDMPPVDEEQASPASPGLITENESAGRMVDADGKKALSEPRAKEAKSLWQKWQRAARANGDIPGGTIVPLARVMKRFVKNNPTHEAAPKFAELAKRVNVGRDWPRDEAAQLLDEVSASYASLPEWVEQEPRFSLGGDVVTGKPLPAALQDAPWGEAQPNGLRVAWLLEPRGPEHRLHTPLRSRVLFHNSGKNSVVFRTLTWNQPGGHKAVNAQGKEISIDSIMWTTLPIAFACRLAPGEFTEVFAAGIGVGVRKDDEDWGDAVLELRIGEWIKARAGSEVTFVPGPIDCNGLDRQLEGEPPPDKSLNWWLRFIQDRLSQDAPLPAAADERARLLTRAVRDLFGNTPTPEELTAFQSDATPTALEALAKRLAERPGFESFSGSLKSGPTKFKVLPIDPAAAQQPRVTKHNGQHQLGGQATFVVTQRPVGERLVNEAHLAFAPTDATQPAPRQPHPVTLPDGYDSWRAAWMRNGTVLWIGHQQDGKTQSIHRIDFTHPAAVQESVITHLKASEQLPQAVLDALQPATGKTADALKKVRTASYTVTRPGGDQPPLAWKVQVLGEHLCRVEQPGGVYLVFDAQAKKVMEVNPGEAKVRITENLPVPDGYNVLAQLSNLQASAAQDQPRLPDREIGGMQATGFAVKTPSDRLNVWVDPVTNLPLLMERLPGNSSVAEQWTGFRFHEAFAASEFSLEVPAGFSVESRQAAQQEGAASSTTSARPQRTRARTESYAFGPGMTPKSQ